MFFRGVGRNCLPTLRNGMLFQMTKKKTRSSTARKPHHRTLMGREQRALTESKIIEAAIHVFAKRGPFEPVIDDFVKAAGVSRGTFYNYFSTTHELLEAAIDTLSNEFMAAILPIVAPIPNPVIRYSIAARLYYRKAELDPVFAGFVSTLIHMPPLASEYARRDLEEAVKLKLAKVKNLDAVYLSTTGTMQASVQHLMQHKGRRRIPGTEVLRAILQSWNVAPELIDEALAVPLPAIKFPPLK